MQTGICAEQALHALHTQTHVTFFV